LKQNQNYRSTIQNNSEVIPVRKGGAEGLLPKELAITKFNKDDNHSFYKHLSTYPLDKGKET